MNRFFNKYGKAIVGAVLAFVTAAQALWSDGHITQQEWVQIAVAAFTAISVYLVPVLHYPYMKTIIAAVLAVLNVLVTVIVGGVSSGDVVEMVLAALTIIGVGFAPARSELPAGVPPDPPLT